MRGVIDVFVGQIKRHDLAAVCVEGPICNLRQARRFVVPCFSNNRSPAPRNFSPVVRRRLGLRTRCNEINTLNLSHDI